jgi:hypothetical protein
MWEMPVAWSTIDFRIGEGGLLRRIETAAHLTRTAWQILIAIGITWVPVVVFGLLNERVRGNPEPLLHHPATHVRLLVAAPVFLFIDQMFPRGCRMTLAQLAFKSFIPEESEAKFRRILESSTRLANSWVPEALLMLVSIGLGVAALFRLVPASGVSKHDEWTAATVWYTLTDWPFVQFLLWRSLWRWAVWVRVLIGLSLIRLDLVPTHPDRRGGISFLRLPSVGYCAFLLFAIASMLCAEWGERLTLNASLVGFLPLLALFAGVGGLIAFGPLLAFAPQLFRARRRGIIDCGGRACDEGRRFQRRVAEARAIDEPAAAVEVSALCDVGVVYREAVDRLQIVLVDRRDLIALLIATLLPVLPMMLLRVPLDDWRALAGILTGGKL